MDRLARAQYARAQFDGAQFDGAQFDGAQFIADGAMLVRAAVPLAVCADLRDAIDQCRMTPSEHYALLSPPGRPVVDSDLFRWFDVPAVREALFTSPLAR